MKPRPLVGEVHCLKLFIGTVGITEIWIFRQHRSLLSATALCSFTDIFYDLMRMQSAEKLNSPVPTVGLDLEDVKPLHEKSNRVCLVRKKIIALIQF